MSNPTNNWDYYYFQNSSSLIQEFGVNSLIDFRYLHDIVNTKIGEFEYEGLPKDLTSEILEHSLCFYNKLCFYKSATMGVILCRYMPNSEYNLYWKPITVQLMTLNGITINTNVPYEDIVLVRDNTMDIIPFLYIREYVSKMVEMENTLLKNVKLLQLPAVYSGDKGATNTFKSLMKKTLDIEPFTLTDSKTVDEFKQFDIQFPVKPEEMLSLYKNYKNMCLESIGVYGVETQKRERLLVKEVQSQTEYIDFMYQMCLNSRTKFVKECNEKFGTNITIKEVYKMFREEEIDLIAQEEKKVTEASNAGGSDDSNNR